MKSPKPARSMLRSSLVALIIFFHALTTHASPSQLTFQGRILKSDGTPLETNNVSFVFQITDPAGSCVIYQEQTTGYSMVNSGGVFDVPIGKGTIQYPLSGPSTVLDSFNNATASFSCGVCSSGSGTYSCADGSSTYQPSEGDTRKLRVSFYDGVGWRTISPDSVIRSVPFAGYALSAQKLGTNKASDFLTKVGIPTCAAGTFLAWNGTALTCGGVAGASGGTVTDVSSTNSYITVANSGSTPQLTLQVGTGANTVAAGNDSRLVNALQTGATAGGDLGGTYPNPTLAKLNGKTFSISSLNTGDVLKYNGTSWINTSLSTADLSDASGLIKASQMPGNCAANQTLTFSSPTGTWTCSAITLSGTAFGSQNQNLVLASPNGANGVPTFRALTAADLPASGVTTGTYKSVTVDATGRVTGGSNPSTAAGYGITDAFVNGGNSFGGNAVLGTADNNSLSINTNNAARMTFTSSGNVGIGVTAPTAPLQVEGNGANGVALLQNDRPNSANSTVLTLYKHNSTGVGANNIGANLTFSTDNSAGAQTPAGWIGGILTDVTSGSEKGALLFTTATGGVYNERMRIDSTGNVGVGTMAPSAMLNVYSASTTYTAPMLRVQQGGTFAAMPDYAANIQTYANRATLGTGTQHGLYVQAGWIGDTFNTEIARFSALNTGYVDVPRMVIQSSGNVGIGTTTPTVSLDLGSKTDAIRLPAGTTAQQPATPASGMLRYNTTTNLAEVYQNGAWVALTTSAGGSNVTTNASGAVTVAAGGTNQNVTLQASGTGVVTSPSVMTLTGGQASTSASSGALVVSGGVGISGDVNAGGNVVAGGVVSATGHRAAQGAPNNADSSTNGYSFTPDGDTGMFSPGSGSANGVIAFFSNNAEKMRIAGNYVGMGTSAPTAPLHVVSTFTSTSGGPYGMIGKFDVNPASASTAGIAAAIFSTNYVSTSDMSGGAIYGSQGYANNNSTSIVGNAMGSYGEVDNITTGSITNAYGNKGVVRNLSTGSIGNAYGFTTAVTNATGGTITNSYELQLSTSNSGTITNQYGLYQATASSKNYFAGNVGIGTTNPLDQLDLGIANQGMTMAGNTYIASNVYWSGGGWKYRGNGIGGSIKLTDNGSGGMTFNMFSNNTSGAGVTANSTPLMTLMPNGNVGIGTTSPSNSLTVVSNNAAGSKYSSVVLTPYDTTGSNNIQWLKDSGNSYSAAIGMSMPGAAVTNDLTFSTGVAGAWSERMRLSNSGNLGIGTTTPSANLDVTVAATNTASVITNTGYGAGTWGGWIMNRQARGTPQAPTAVQTDDQMSVYGARGYGATGFSSTSRASVRMFASENWTDTNQGAYLTFDTTANGSAATAERMRILGNGNVGIGTTSPVWKMTVAGGTANALFTTTDYAAGTTGSGLAMGTGANTGTTYSFIQGVTAGGSSNNGNISINAGGGNVGIGTSSPAAKLDVSGANPYIYVSNTNGATKRSGMMFASGGTAQFEIGTDSGLSGARNFYIWDDVVNTARVLVDASGNVGIGTTSPGAPLEVKGYTNLRAPVANSYDVGLRFYSNGTSTNDLRNVIRTSPDAGRLGAFEILRFNPNTGAEIDRTTYNNDGTWNFPGCIYYLGGQSGTCPSDMRLKKDVQQFDVGLNALLGIHPVHFKYNGLGGIVSDGKEQLGVIAQDLEMAAPDLVKRKMVTLHPDDKEQTEIKIVDYNAFTYVIINAVKEFYAHWFNDSQTIHREIASLKEENQQIKREKDEMKIQNEQMKSYLCSKDPSAPFCK